MIRTRATRFLALAAAALLVACSSTPLPPLTAAPVENRSPGATQGEGAAAAAAAAAAGAKAAAAAAQSSVATVDLAAGGIAGGALSARDAELAAMQRVIYFDFDSYAIKDEFKPLIDRYAKVLATDKGRRLTVEGHTDERGGREYNLALGQKRAESVARALELLGARDSQIEAVSFGKERPADGASNESAWAKNRRAELKDR